MRTRFSVIGVLVFIHWLMATTVCRCRLRLSYRIDEAN